MGISAGLASLKIGRFPTPSDLANACEAWPWVWRENSVIISLSPFERYSSQLETREILEPTVDVRSIFLYRSGRWLALHLNHHHSGQGGEVVNDFSR